MFRNFKDPKYIQWRKDVYKRDGFKCQWPNCNQNRKLNAHHIKNWANFPGLRFVIDNGITLLKTPDGVQSENIDDDADSNILEVYCKSLIAYLRSLIINCNFG